MTEQRKLTRNLPMLHVRAEVREGSIDVKARTVELVWTTGARVMRGWWDQYWEELSLDPAHIRMGRLESGSAPLLNSHRSADLSAQIGVVEKAWLEAELGVALVRFAKAEDDPVADSIFRKVVDRIIRNVSVGYAVHRLEKVEETADQIPVMRATDWEPFEISIVPIGADAGAVVRSAAEGQTTPCEFVFGSPLEETRMSVKKNDPQGGAVAPVADSSTGERAAPAPVLDDSERQRMLADERARVAEIGRLARGLGLEDSFVAGHVERGTSLADFKAAAVDELAKTKRNTRGVADVAVTPIESIEDARDKWLRGAEAWLVQKASVGEVVGRAAEKRGEKLADPAEFRGLSLVDLARQSLERAGVSVRGLGKMDIVGKAFTQRSYGAQGTGDFTYLLENVLHKTLLGAYAITPDDWSRFCKKSSVSDFRAHPRYRQGAFGVLDTVNELGEFKNKAILDGEKTSITAGTKGNIIALSRQAIVNDDMGSFTDLATRLGRAAKLTIEVAVFDLLKLNSGLGPTQSDSQPLFHANRSNVGTGAAISAAALDADSVVMGVQKDPSGNEQLALIPSILVLPRALGGQARVINDSQYDPDTLANKSQMKPNIAAKMFTDIVASPRLTGTRRYLFADPAIAPVIEVAFLEGVEEPYLEMQEGWRVDGAEWKVRLDFGVAATDFRGAVTNAGA